MKNQKTEYTVATEPEGDTRIFDSRAETRDFIEENYEIIRGRVEKRVWDCSECNQDAHHYCKVDEQKTEMIKIDKFMKARSDWK